MSSRGTSRSQTRQMTIVGGFPLPTDDPDMEKESGDGEGEKQNWGSSSLVLPSPWCRESVRRDLMRLNKMQTMRILSPILSTGFEREFSMTCLMIMADSALIWNMER